MIQRTDKVCILILPQSGNKDDGRNYMGTLAMFRPALGRTHVFLNCYYYPGEKYIKWNYFTMKTELFGVTFYFVALNFIFSM